MMREEFLLIADLNSVLSDFRSSLWYAQGRDAIARGQRFSHKDRVATTLPELDEIFSGYLVPLLETMQRDGYVQRPGTDLPEAMIGRDGTLIKTAHGTHRLASAKVCGVTQGFPVKVVGVHRIWLDSLPDKNPDQIKSALKQIEAAYQ
ncbi:hypothetical protein [Aestuariivita sp.]|uniref:hypothetical protein n=1 Tax=Aestuariivita sp. TaxID=1872407 RepID=UPI003BB039B8